MNHIARKNWTRGGCLLRSGFLLGALAALLLALPSSLYAQSPLTIQPSTGRVGVGNTNPDIHMGRTTLCVSTFRIFRPRDGVSLV
jgi:hypothetical protein